MGRSMTQTYLRISSPKSDTNIYSKAGSHQLMNYSEDEATFAGCRLLGET